MALIAEELVEEWLNREGFFTIRGIRVGRGEMDLLAIRSRSCGQIEGRHVEVQASVGPIGYIASHKIKSARKRTKSEIKREARAWVKRKFKDPEKRKVRTNLCPVSQWSFHLVHGNVKDKAELSAIKELGVQLHDVRDLLEIMRMPRKRDYSGATGKDLVDLITAFGPESPAKKTRKARR